MEAARHFDSEDPYGPNGRLSRLTPAQRREGPSEEYDVLAEEGVLYDPTLDPRPVVDPLPIDAPLTAETGFDFEQAATLRVETTDSPETVIQRLRVAGGVFNDEGDFAPGADQLEMIHYALDGNLTALGVLPKNSGLRQWTETHRDSLEAREIFDRLHRIMHPAPGGEEPVASLTSLFESAEPDFAQPSEPAQKPALGKRVLRKLNPRFS